MPIRVAPERPKQEVQRLIFTKRMCPTPATPSTAKWREARRTSISKGEKQPGAGSGQQAGFTSSSSDVGGNQSLSLETTIRQFMRDMASGLNDLKTRMATVESKCEAAYEAAVEYSMDTDEELSELSEIDASKPRKKVRRKVFKY